MRHHAFRSGRLAALAGCFVLSLAGLGKAEGLPWDLYFSLPGGPLDPVWSIEVQAGDPFELSVVASFLAPPGPIIGYAVDFGLTAPTLEFAHYTDALGLDPLGTYPEFFYLGGTYSPPGPVFELGTIAFTASGAGMVDVVPFGCVVIGETDFHPCLGATPVTVSTAPVPPPPILPPPVPPSYDMGMVTNGDFQADGGSLAGWDTTAYENSHVRVVELSNGHTDHVGLLHSEGRWEYMWDPWMPEEWHYCSGYAEIEQTVYVPPDATTLSFTYCTRSGGALDGDPYAEVQLGDASQRFDETADWTAATMTVPEAAKGRRVPLALEARDNGYGWAWGDEWTVPEGTKWLDMYVDYIGLDGTATTIQTTTWAGGTTGGPWADPANWDPQDVPDNAPGKVHDVVVPASASGEGTITAGAPRTVQTLTDERTAGVLEIGPGCTLTVMEDAAVDAATVRIAAGGRLDVGWDLRLVQGTGSIHPAGSAAGGDALSVGRDLRIGESWPNFYSADLAVTDATATVGDDLFVYSDSTVTLTTSPAFAGPTRLVVQDGLYLYGNSRLTVGAGAEVATGLLYVDSGAHLRVEGGAIRDLSPGRTSNSGTTEFVGDVLFDQDRFSNGGVLTVSGGQTHVTGDLNLNYGQLAVIGATLRVDGDLKAYAGCSLSADAASTIAIGSEWVNQMSDGAAFNMDAARMLFDGAGASWMEVAGMNRGPFSSGLMDNFAVGLLEVGAGTHLYLSPSGEGSALYVYDLTIQAGSTLDLLGLPVYYSGQFVNQGACVGGTPQRLYQRPPGLPSVSPVTYTAEATACYTTDTQTDQAAQAQGEDWGWGGGYYVDPATAEAYADLTQQGDAALLVLDIVGQAGTEEIEDPGMPPMPMEIPTSASAGIEGTIEIGANGAYPAGTPLELLIIPTMRTLDSGWAFDWWCTVEHGIDSVAFGPGNAEAVLWDVLAGDTVEVRAWIEDHTEWGWFDHRLEVTFMTVPEPVTASLLGVGALAMLRRRRLAGRRLPE